MTQVSEYLADWMRMVAENTTKIECLQLRIDPVQDEVDTLYRKLDTLIADTPTWHDYVVEPLIEMLERVYTVKRLKDRTIMQMPVMLIVPALPEVGPKTLMVLFRLTDKVTGEFFITITGFTPDSEVVTRKIVSDIFMTTDSILKTINEVRELL